MKRIMLIGCPGSGKTTLATKLQQRLNIPVYHLDQVMWLENYQPIPYQDFLSKVDEIITKDTWIIDGNFTRSIPDRIDMADTVIFFDTPRHVCMWRLVKRYVLNFNEVRPDVGRGNKNTLGFKLLKFVATFPRETIYEMLENFPPQKKLYIVKNKKDLHLLLNNLSK